MVKFSTLPIFSPLDVFKWKSFCVNFLKRKIHLYLHFYKDKALKYVLKQLLILLIPSPLSTELQSSSCGNPGVPPKGVLYGTRFDVGDKIRYSCVTGYILDGHPQLTCIANSVNTASWDFPVPICRGKEKNNVNFFVD